MTALAQTLDFDFTQPSILAARAVADRLASGRALDRRDLMRIMEQAHGGGAADGHWTLRQAYDALEAGEVLYLRHASFPDSPGDILAHLEALTARLPTHSVRSEEQIALQQFSTPAPIAYIVALALNLTSADVVLEPSAGTGLLAVFAARAGAALILNEIDPGRATLLGAAFPEATVTRHDGELIDDFLPRDQVPSAVLINPPFSRSIGRQNDPLACLRHLRSALRRLAPGGRCAAILPHGIDTATAEWRRVAQGCEVVADLRLPPRAYAKHGTSMGVKLVVLRKGGEGRTGVLDCATLADALAAVLALAEGPRIAALPVARPAPSKPSLFGAVKRAPLALTARAAKAGAETVPLAYTILADPAPVGEAAGHYLPYRPSRLAIAGAKSHPTALVESIAMGSITAPPASYVPLLPPRLIADGLLSEAQLETLIYAGDAFERDLPGCFTPADEGVTLNPDAEGQRYRTGFFLGDGTGAGKGRQVAAIFLDQWLRGRRKHVWISKSETLLEDARRDWTALGGLDLDIQHLNQWPLGRPIAMSEGIIFLTYATLRSNRGDKGTRLQQLLDWLGTDFEGLIAFDEAHEMQNVAGGEGRFGTKDGSEQGIAGLRLQNLLPRARVFYVSATGASDVNNLAYATRLGLWGPGTAFANRREFVDSLRRGGIAAMELIARDLKMQGLYLARALSFSGVEYDVLEQKLTPEQIAIYDAYADAFAVIHANVQAALDATRVVDKVEGATYNSGAKSAAISVFESVKQRAFCQLLIGMKLPALIPAITADLARGECAVIQLVSTSEAMLNRTLAALTPEERANLDVQLSPLEGILGYLRASFPVRMMKTFTDENGKVRSEPMSDGDGSPVISREAEDLRDAMIEEMCALPLVGSALDHIIGHFGTEMVAEVTGRSRRIVVGPDGRQRVEARSARTNLAETDAFMRGDKPVLIFSDAGGTGRSYHASLDCESRKRRRNHYLLEPGWRADAAIQGLGRTHRTAQQSAPLFRPVSTDCRGERRFISTIARRLDSLGALTRGQRQTGGQGLFDPRDNLESEFARESLVQWFGLLFAGKLRSVTFAEFQRLTGLRLEGGNGGLTEDLPPIQRWLNRILALRIAMQNAIFDEYLGLIEARVEAARAAGTLDVGVETIKAERLTILERSVIRTDPVSGAETEILRIEAEERYRPLSLDRAIAMLDGDFTVPMINDKSGKAAIRENTFSLTDEDGEIVHRYELIRPVRTERIRADELAESSWAAASREEFRKAWQAEYDALKDKTRTSTIYLVAGLLLPVWGHLPEDHVQVRRLTTDDGQSFLGRIVPAHELGRLTSALGIDAGITMTPDEVARYVMASGALMPVGTYNLKRSLVMGEHRLELVDWPHTRLAELKAMGLFSEVIAYRTRLFVPVSEAAAILARITA